MSGLQVNKYKEQQHFTLSVLKLAVFNNHYNFLISYNSNHMLSFNTNSKINLTETWM